MRWWRMRIFRRSAMAVTLSRVPAGGVHLPVIPGARSRLLFSLEVVRSIPNTQGRRTACRLTKERDMKNNTLAIALASLLVGGVAVAAFQNNTRDEPSLSAHDAGLAPDVVEDRDAIPASGRVEYADIVDVQEITEA